MSKSERRAAQDVVMRAKSPEEVAAGFKIEMGRGKEIIEEIEKVLLSRVVEKPDIFEERKEAEDEGKVVDEKLDEEDKEVLSETKERDVDAEEPKILI
jgi:hypothetical protein